MRRLRKAVFPARSSLCPLATGRARPPGGQDKHLLRLGTEESPPRSKASGDEKGPERGRQQIHKNEGQQKVELRSQVFAERVLAGQCSGRNLEENKNYDCRHHGH